MRLLLTVGAGLILFLEVYRNPISDWGWFLYFHHWSMMLQLVYFCLASLLTVTAVCSAGSGGIARTTPFVVRITELLYGAIVPAVWISALVLFCIQYCQRRSCVPVTDTSNPLTGAILGGFGLLIMFVDQGFNRQPYYASFHAIVGLLFCWAWLLFSAMYEMLGGRDMWGHSYIYRCLDWSYPIPGGRMNALGKLLFLNFFVLTPLINYLYWLLIWARRRTLTLYKKQEPMLQQPLTQTPRPPSARRMLFEWSADYRDLALDGRHWRAQFGGSSGKAAPKMGAYICFDATFYPGFRLALAGVAAVLFAMRAMEFSHEHEGQASLLMLYFDNWVLCLSVVYFSLAALLTGFASCTDGAESNSTPLIVWITWATYGALLPAALLNSCMFIFVTTRYTLTGLTAIYGLEINRIFDVAGNFGTTLIVLLDAWVNRQPYYATYHAMWGTVVSWAYLAFNVVYVLNGGNNELGLPYIYRALNWRTALTLEQFMTPGKLTVIELFVFIPLLNMLYWCMLWARRRARVAAKQQAV